MCFSFSILSRAIVPKRKHAHNCSTAHDLNLSLATETAMGIKVHAQQQADNEYVESVYR